MKRFGAVALASCLAALPSQARDEPLWEAGIGAAGLRFPDYRGSSEARNYLLPAPYVVYRGDFLKADRHGIRGTLFSSDRVNLNLSLGASLPVESEDNRAREGMPDLKPSIEVGPSLHLTAWRSENRGARLDFRFPLRGAVTVASDPRFIGGQFFPHANLDLHDPAGFRDWNLGLLAGPVFTDKRYNRYFYQVAPEHATATRRAYEPGSGYAGTQFLAALSKRFPKYWIGGFVRYDTLRGAAFADSPLVTSKRYVAAGIAFSWVFAESSRRVAVDRFGQQ